MITRDIIKEIAESDPVHIHDGDLYCFYCNTFWVNEDNAIDGNWHMPDCLWAHCREQMEERDRTHFAYKIRIWTDSHTGEPVNLEYLGIEKVDGKDK